MFTALQSLRSELATMYPAANVCIEAVCWRFSGGSVQDTIKVYARGDGVALNKEFFSLDEAKLFINSLREYEADLRTGSIKDGDVRQSLAAAGF